MGTEFIEDDWKEAIDVIRSASTCNRLRETQYKILYRLHITPVILHKIDCSISPLSSKCKSERGTYFTVSVSAHLELDSGSKLPK